MLDTDLTKYEKLEVVMYAMTLTERANKRDFWMHQGGFARLHKRGGGTLLNYWKKRLDEDPDVEALLNRTWEQFKQDAEKPFNHTKQSPQVNAPEKSGISALTKARSLLNAAKNFAKDGFVFVSDSVFNQRLDICKGCPEWDPSSFLNTGSCTLCGCSTKAKLRLPSEKCPIDKWLPVNVQEHQSSNSETPDDQSTQASQ